MPGRRRRSPLRGDADHEGMDYKRWRLEHLFLLLPAQQYVGQFLGTFKEFSPGPS